MGMPWIWSWLTTSLHEGTECGKPTPKTRPSGIPATRSEQAEAGPQQPAEAGETAEKQSHGAVPSSAWAVAVPVTETVLMSTRLSRYG